MNILLTNDDGVEAAGLKALFNALKSNFNVYIIAPDGERSACSNAITIRQDLFATKINENIYSLSGYTSDCINVGLHCDFIPKIDLVISGINHGQNVADDIIYSGTVAGARTAFINAISGISVSINSYGKISNYFNDAAVFITNFLSEHKSQLITSPHFYNINYPDLHTSKITGIEYTTVGKKNFYDSYTSEPMKNDSFILKLAGHFDHEKTSGSDVNELLNGKISITPMALQYTDFNKLNDLKKKKPAYGSN